MGNLAALHRSLAHTDFGYHDEGLIAAACLLERSLNIKEHLYGDDSLKLVKTLTNLSHVYSEQHRYEEVSKYLERALEICRRLLGEDHPDCIVAESNYATSFSKLREYKKAKKLLILALNHAVVVLGEAHPVTAKCFKVRLQRDPRPSKDNVCTLIEMRLSSIHLPVTSTGEAARCSVAKGKKAAVRVFMRALCLL